MSSFLITLLILSIVGGFSFADKPPPDGAFMVTLCDMRYYNEESGNWVCIHDEERFESIVIMDGLFQIEPPEAGWFGLVMKVPWRTLPIMPHYPGTDDPIHFEFDGANVDIGILEYSDKWCEVDPLLECISNLFIPIVKG